MYCLPGQESDFSLNPVFSPLFTTPFLHSRIIWKNVFIRCLQSLSSPPPQHSLAFIPVVLPVHLLSRSAVISEIQWPALRFHLSHLFRSVWLSQSFFYSWKVFFFFLTWLLEFCSVDSLSASVTVPLESPVLNPPYFPHLWKLVCPKTQFCTSQVILQVFPSNAVTLSTVCLAHDFQISLSSLHLSVKSRLVYPSGWLEIFTQMFH